MTSLEKCPLRLEFPPFCDYNFYQLYGMKWLICFKGDMYDGLDIDDHFVEKDEDYPDISTCT